MVLHRHSLSRPMVSLLECGFATTLHILRIRLEYQLMKHRKHRLISKCLVSLVVETMRRACSVGRQVSYETFRGTTGNDYRRAALR